MRKLLFLFSSFIILIFSGCDFFTTSWGTGARRNLEENYSKLSSSELADLISDPNLINDTEAGKQLLSALGKKDDLSSLSVEQKNAVLNLSVNSSITSDTVSEILSAIKDTENSENKMEQLVTDILEKVDSADISAVTQILSDKESLGQLDDKALCLSSLCLIAQVAKQENLLDKTATIKDEISSLFEGKSNVDDAVNNITASADCSAESNAALKAALNAVCELKDSEASLIEGLKISDLFGSLSSSS
ncbi:MAG: hypothetical protein ACI4LX_03790 [Treponema sp.]